MSEQNAKKPKLEELAKSSSRRACALPQGDEDLDWCVNETERDWEAEYRKVFAREGIAGVMLDIAVDEAMSKMDLAKRYLMRIKCDSFAAEVINTFQKRWGNLDTRDPLKVIYPYPVMLMVCCLCSCCGAGTDVPHFIDFWRDFNPQLQVLVPGMPPPRYIPSPSTFQRMMTLFGAADLDQYFAEFYGSIKLRLEDIPAVDAPPDKGSSKEYMQTWCSDGQTPNGTRRRGEYSSNKHAGDIVSVLHANQLSVKSYSIVDRKNNEDKGLMQALDSIALAESTTNPNDVIITFDAGGNKRSALDELNKREFHIAAALKNNNGWGHVFNYVSREGGGFADVRNIASLKVRIIGQEEFSDSGKQHHGRDVTKQYEMISVENFPQYVKDTLPTYIKSIFHVYTVTKIKCSKLKEGTEPPKDPEPFDRYWMTDLECNDENFDQMVHSNRLYWMVESNHYTLDRVWRQDEITATNKNYIAFRIWINKIGKNVTAFALPTLSKHYAPNRKRHISYQRATDILNRNFLTLFHTFLCYWKTNPDGSVKEDWPPPPPQPSSQALDLKLMHSPLANR